MTRAIAERTEGDAACAIIARSTVAAVDLGLARATYFVNVVSVGLGAAVIGAVSPAATLARLGAGGEASKHRRGGMGMARSQPACPWCCCRKMIEKGRIERRVERPITTKVCPCPGTPERLQHGERHTRTTRHGTAHCVVAVHDKRLDEPSGDLAQHEQVDNSPFDAVEPRCLICRLLASSQSFLILLLAFSYGILNIRPYP